MGLDRGLSYLHATPSILGVAPEPQPPLPVEGGDLGIIFATMASDRRKRLRERLEGAREARVSEVEAYLEACGWRQRSGKGSHRAWTKEGRRTLVIPMHGGRVREYVIRQVLEATSDDNETG
ncbi:MAG: type II toxin-antitoxin system HicA family toxin [Acidimicrobiia bacterium]